MAKPVARTSDVRAAEVMEVLRPEMLGEAISIVRGNASLLAAIGSGETLRKGEKIKVDLKKATFEVKSAKGTILSGDCQLIGIHVPETGLWSWGFHKPSHPSRAYRDIEDALRSDEELVPLADCGEFKLPAHRALELSGWVAHRAGFRGAYPMVEGDRVLYLALNLTRLVKHSTKPEENLWCVFCGSDGRDGETLLKMTEAHAICADCVDDAVDVIAVNEELAALKGKGKEEAKPLAEDAPLALSYCVLCEGRKAGLVSLNAVACVCTACVAAAAELLVDQKTEN